MKGFLGSGSGSKNAAVETLIGRQTEILGDVRFAGGLHLDGRIKGLVTASGDKAAMLSVSDTGIIEGDVRVPTMMLNGAVIGEVRTSERLVLNAKARVTGNVYYKLLQMEPGATINGQLVHDIGGTAALTHQKPTEQGVEAAVLGIEDAGRGTAG